MADRSYRGYIDLVEMKKVQEVKGYMVSKFEIEMVRNNRPAVNAAIQPNTLRKRSDVRSLGWQAKASTTNKKPNQAKSRSGSRS